MLSGCASGTLADWAMLAIPLPVWRVLPRLLPASRSGCVTRPTTSPPNVEINASNVGSANVPVPIMTIRIQESSERNADDAESGHADKRGSEQRLMSSPRSSAFSSALSAFRLLKLCRQVGWEFALLLVLLEVGDELLQVLLAAVQTERPHFVDEQHAVEVVDLVLPDAGRQVVADHLVEFALEVISL